MKIKFLIGDKKLIIKKIFKESSEEYSKFLLQKRELLRNTLFDLFEDGFIKTIGYGFGFRLPNREDIFGWFEPETKENILKIINTIEEELKEKIYFTKG